MRVEGTDQWVDTNALWDTGATVSMVTETIFNSCHFKVLGISKSVASASSTQAGVLRYAMDIDFGNGLLFTDIDVSVRHDDPNDNPKPFRFGSSGVLVGMNIIGQGDFVVTQRWSGTQFYFRRPSGSDLDGFIRRCHSEAQQQRPQSQNRRDRRRQVR